MSVAPWVRELTESVLGRIPKVGDAIIVAGRRAVITHGNGWGGDGWSGFYDWRYLDGRFPKTGCGYGDFAFDNDPRPVTEREDVTASKAVAVHKKRRAGSTPVRTTRRCP